MDLFDALTRFSALGVAFEINYRHLFGNESPRHLHLLNQDRTNPELTTLDIGSIVQDAYRYQTLTRRMNRASRKLSKGSYRSKDVSRKIKRWSSKFKSSSVRTHTKARTSDKVFHLTPDDLEGYIKPILGNLQSQVNSTKAELSSVNQLQKETTLLKQWITQENETNEESSSNQTKDRAFSFSLPFFGKSEDTKELEDARDKISQLTEELAMAYASIEQLKRTSEQDQEQLDRLAKLVDQVEDNLQAKAKHHQDNERLLESAEQLLMDIEQQFQ